MLVSKCCGAPPDGPLIEETGVCSNCDFYANFIPEEWWSVETRDVPGRIGERCIPPYENKFVKNKKIS